MPETPIENVNTENAQIENADTDETEPPSQADIVWSKITDNDLSDELLTAFPAQGWTPEADLAVLRSQSFKEYRCAYHFVIPLLHRLHHIGHLRNNSKGQEAVRARITQLTNKLDEQDEFPEVINHK